jgi:hypothetical protein
MPSAFKNPSATDLVIFSHPVKPELTKVYARPALAKRIAALAARRASTGILLTLFILRTHAKPSQSVGLARKA